MNPDEAWGTMDQAFTFSLYHISISLQLDLLGSDHGELEAQCQLQGSGYQADSMEGSVGRGWLLGSVYLGDRVYAQNLSKASQWGVVWPFKIGRGSQDGSWARIMGVLQS